MVPLSDGELLIQQIPGEKPLVFTLLGYLDPPDWWLRAFPHPTASLLPLEDLYGQGREWGSVSGRPDAEFGFLAGILSR